MTSELATPEISIESIERAENVRGDVGDTSELEGSIENIGLIEPVVVRANGDGRYQLLAGFRRLQALVNLGHETVPVRVVDRPEEDAEASRIALQLVENLQRVDLDPVEEASGYAQLKQYGWKQNQIAKRLGRSQAHVSKRLALLQLPSEVLDFHEVGRLTTEDLYELHKVVAADADLAPIMEQVAATDRDDTPDPAGEVRQLVKSSLRLKEIDDKVSARKAELEAEGVTVLEAQYDRSGWPTLPKDQINYFPLYGVDITEHEKEPCHAVCVYDRMGTLSESAHCTDKRRHQKDGASDIKVPALDRDNSPDEEAKARQEELAEKRRQDERRAEKRTEVLHSAVQDLLGGRPPAKDKIFNLAADWLVHVTWEDYAGDVALDLLDLMPSDGAAAGDYPNLREIYEAADGPNRMKIILACALAHPIEWVSDRWLDEENDDTYRQLMATFADLGVTDLEKKIRIGIEADDAVEEAIAQGEEEGL